MKNLFILPILFILFISCEKDNDKVQVIYKAANAYSTTIIKYRDVSGSLISENINFASAEDEWQFQFDTKKGEIVYLSALYSDSTSSVKLQIIIDGKVFKEGSSNNEPDKYVTVSGSIPY